MSVWFSRHGDSVVVDSAEWPTDLPITVELIQSADAKWLSVYGPFRASIGFHVENGFAIYRRRWFKRTLNRIAHYRLVRGEIRGYASGAPGGGAGGGD